MTSESAQSAVDSDDNSDYLMKGLNWHNKGDIIHLPPDKQAIVRKQRQLAMDQGAFKYIGPIKGKKVPIEVNDHEYWRNETKQKRPCV